MTAQPERYGAFVESPRARDALAMLAGTLPNMDGYGGINAVLTSIPRPSEAQDATSLDASTARTAEAGPDAETRTLNPPGVYITGPDAEATFQALDRYSALDLRFDRVTGRVTDVPLMADGEANLSQRDYALLQLLRDMGKDITLETTRSDRPIDRDGNVQNLAVGMYNGSDTDQQSGQVSARNVFNLRHAEVLERVAGASVGGSALHELVEAYAGARSSPGVHYSQSSYGTAHSYASSLDENPVLPWKTDFATDPTTGEIYVAIVVDKDPSVPGYEDVNNLYRVI